jgi:hypothetical protein
MVDAYQANRVGHCSIHAVTKQMPLSNTVRRRTVERRVVFKQILLDR